MIYYLVAVEETNGFDTTGVEVFLFSNESDAKAFSSKKQEQKRGNGKVKIVPLELDKILTNPECFSGESLDIY